MINLQTEYAKAYVEVLELIKFMPKEIVDLIPKEQIQMFKKFKSTYYKFTYNPDLEFNEQNISLATKAIFAYLYEDYINKKI